jgi:hypothetical protein
MRIIARFEKGRGGTVAPSLPGYSPGSEYRCPIADYAGSGQKVDLTSLLPGGMTKGAAIGSFQSLPAGGPEPVNGFGAAKGIIAYYRAVQAFRAMPVIR